MTAAIPWDSVVIVARRFVRAHGELVLVGGLGLIAQAELWLDRTWAQDRRGLSVIALAMTAALLLRLRAPVATLALAVAGLVAMDLVNGVADNDPMAMVVIALVAVYSAGAHARGRTLLAAAALVVVMAVLGVAQDGDSLNVSGFLFFGIGIGAPFLAGVAIRIRRERERLLERERDERARLAVAEERTRIARELHDVVAHAISVIVLQARGARHALRDDPQDARAAIDSIERTASQALAEMRRLLAILRTEADPDLLPQPSLAHLDALAGEVRRSGLPVEVRVEGAPRPLEAGMDASAYRIVQEALTNALKHAGEAHARVTVRYGVHALELRVVDNGPGGAAGDGGGHGLISMRERAALFGGTIEAGVREGGGYVVDARLPW
jgi:signal transduction histidine kinase